MPRLYQNNQQPGTPSESPDYKQELEKIFNDCSKYMIDNFNYMNRNHSYENGFFYIDSYHDFDFPSYQAIQDNMMKIETIPLFLFLQHLVNKFNLSPIEIRWGAEKDQSPVYVKTYDHCALIKADEFKIIRNDYSNTLEF